MTEYRLESTSAGTVHSGKEQDGFFAGFSIPRNKTLMRVFKDLEIVEYLGSGMPRILKAYPRDAYGFSSRFIRTTFELSVTRQLYYSSDNKNSLDMALFVNALPVVTAELKNPMTGQTVEHAKKQYENDRECRLPQGGFRTPIASSP